MLRRQRSSSGAEISRDREQARSEVIRYFWVLRAFVLRAGELTGLGDDIFFLDSTRSWALNGETLEPTRSPSAGGCMPGYAALPPLPALIRGRFDPVRLGGRSRDGVSDGLSSKVTPGEAQASGHGHGFPGSAGMVEGRVR